MIPPPGLLLWWSDLAASGWQGAKLEARTLYPMPGDARFDQDELFVDLPLFPTPEGGAIHVRDDLWETPIAWHREYETRPTHTLKHKFHIKGDYSEVDVQEIKINIKRCMYLEFFSHVKPLSISTLRIRRQFYTRLGHFSLSEGRKFSELLYVDLIRFIEKLPKNLRKSVPPVYKTLRLWKALAPESYRMFEPPPSLQSVGVDDTEGIEQLHDGLDVSAIRDGNRDAEDDRKWQPFPDKFVAAAGEFCLRVLEGVRPIVNSVLRELRALPRSPTPDDVAVIAKARSWPDGFYAGSSKDLIALANLCQTATIFILSLLLGPRWEEVAALPRRKFLVSRRTQGKLDSFINGNTFKLSNSFSGSKRDWPISPELRRIIIGQLAYIRVSEDHEFRFFLRKCNTLFDGGEPKRQIAQTLVRFAAKNGFSDLLDGTSCHHHRFRKTTARLIVIALHGGPSILRRLFGHENLAMTLRYILANDGILEELRELAEEEQRQIAIAYVERAEELRGGGANQFQVAISRLAENLDVIVPTGKRDQARLTAEDIVDRLTSGPDGFAIKQLLPGLVACCKPIGEAGACASENELPNIAKCKLDCAWHLEMPEFLEQARINVSDALSHMRKAEPGSLIWSHYSRVVREKLNAFPELLDEFAEDPIVSELLEVADG
ncbi:hypothetical protein [Bosea sp. BIWAKO-01]|uniref:hypothetical protein n=1 Tax=Bosea sp. BIWAKO-01 TaxID=506668 RepID=UPI00086B1504|nr:hypothetical protein [Bosea sp. BIWAKO-01]GAU84213.1 hypothetical protein BIWAKO_04145 [Bosea sp. BIWAKO-01]